MLAPPPPRSTASALMGTSRRSATSARVRPVRTPTPGVRKLVADHFTRWGRTVREQPFRAAHPVTGEALVMANLIGSWQPDRLRRVVIGAHYDTRPHPDQEVDPDAPKLPFVGANDCASGVAVLMEIANHLDDLETPWGVDLVLFDGEELVYR